MPNHPLGARPNPDTETDILRSDFFTWWDHLRTQYNLNDQALDDFLGLFGYADETEIPATGAAGQVPMWMSGSNKAEWKTIIESDIQPSEIVTLTDDAVVTMDASLGEKFELFMTVAGDVRALEIVNAVEGGTYQLFVHQDGVGGRDINDYRDPIKMAYGITPTLSPDPGAVTIFYFTADATKVYGVGQGMFA